MRGEVCSDQQTQKNLHLLIFRTATPLLLRGSVFPAFRSSAHYFYDFSTSAIRIHIEKSLEISHSQGFETKDLF